MDNLWGRARSAALSVLPRKTGSWLRLTPSRLGIVGKPPCSRLVVVSEPPQATGCNSLTLILPIAGSSLLTAR
jgi:hypothetical protein